MKSFIQKIKLAMLFTGLTAVVVSCKKDHIPDYRPGEKELFVTLQGAGLSVENIDSANIVFRKQGSSIPVFQRFIKGQDKLHTPTDGLSTGQWQVELDLYTKKAQNGKSLQFVSTQTITLTKEAGVIEIKGPVDDTNKWKKRMVSSTSDNSIVVIIPADVTDPYFEIRAKNPYWHFFGVERTAFKGQGLVASKQWNCQQGCIGNDRLLFDKDIFAPFTEKIKTDQWDRSEIAITVGNTTGQQYNEFNHTWTN